MKFELKSERLLEADELDICSVDIGVGWAQLVLGQPAEGKSITRAMYATRSEGFLFPRGRRKRKKGYAVRLTITFGTPSIISAEEKYLLGTHNFPFIMDHYKNR